MTWDLRGRLLRRLTVVVDTLTLVIAIVFAVGLLSLVTDQSVPAQEIALALLLVPLWPLLGLPLRAYHPRSDGRGLTTTPASEFFAILSTSTAWVWLLLIALTFSVEPYSEQRLTLLLVWILAVPLMLSSRALERRSVRSRQWFLQRVLIIGAPDDAHRLLSRIDRHPEWGLEIAGLQTVINDDTTPSETLDFEGELLRKVYDLRAARVIFATPPGAINTEVDLTRFLIESGVQVDFIPGETDVLRSGAEISDLEGLPLVSLPGARPPRSRELLKRVTDLCLALPLLILCGPLLVVAMLWIRSDSPGKVIYRQVRAGKNGRPFELLKLRTMFEGSDAGPRDYAPEKDAEDPRVTKVGSWLRRSSIDELPQLWNVIKGEMTLVGPRPLPMGQDLAIARRYEIRRQVRPGMTGLWQVNGRSEIPFQDMLRLDYSYVLNWSLALDAQLLLRTLRAVVSRRGAF